MTHLNKAPADIAEAIRSFVEDDIEHLHHGRMSADRLKATLRNQVWFYTGVVPNNYELIEICRFLDMKGADLEWLFPEERKVA